MKRQKKSEQGGTMSREEMIEVVDALQYQSGCASISYHDPNHPTLAGHTAYICTQEQLDKFAELIMEAEREACARVCELLRPSKREYDHRFYDGCTASAAVIRARKHHA